MTKDETPTPGPELDSVYQPGTPGAPWTKGEVMSMMTMLITLMLVVMILGVILVVMVVMLLVIVVGLKIIKCPGGSNENASAADDSSRLECEEAAGF